MKTKINTIPTWLIHVLKYDSWKLQEVWKWKKKQRMDINNSESSHLEVENGKELVQIWSRKFYSKFPVDWEDFLEIDELSIDNSTEM